MSYPNATYLVSDINSITNADNLECVNLITSSNLTCVGTINCSNMNCGPMNITSNLGVFDNLNIGKNINFGSIENYIKGKYIGISGNANGISLESNASVAMHISQRLKDLSIYGIGFEFFGANININGSSIYNINKILGINAYGLNLDVDGATNVNCLKNFDMKNNQILNVSNVSANDVLTLSGGTGNLILNSTSGIINSNKNLDMKNNQILNVSNVSASGSLGFTTSGGDINFNPSSQNINCNNNKLINVSTISGTSLNLNVNAIALNYGKPFRFYNTASSNYSGIQEFGSSSTNKNYTLPNIAPVFSGQNNLLACDPSGNLIWNNYKNFVMTTDGPTITNTITEFSLVGTVSGSKTVPANSVSVGSSFRIRASGVIKNIINEQIAFSVWYGNQSMILITTGAMPHATALTSWTFDGLFTFRAIGASGTVQGTGMWNFKDGSNINIFNTDINTTNVDTTIDRDLDVRITWGSANTGDSITMKTCVINRAF